MWETVPNKGELSLTYLDLPFRRSFTLDKVLYTRRHQLGVGRQAFTRLWGLEVELSIYIAANGRLLIVRMF